MGYFPVLSEHDSSWLVRSNADPTGAAEDVETKRRTGSTSSILTDVSSDLPISESQEGTPSVAVRTGNLGIDPPVTVAASRDATNLSREAAQDADSSLDTLAASLPSFYAVGWAEEQGKRSEMEDGTVVIRNFGGMPDAWLLAIYDGHGGRATVSLLLQRLHENLLHFLEERGNKRWKNLKGEAQSRRRVLLELLESQEQRLQAQLQSKPKRRRRRLHCESQLDTRCRAPARKTTVADDTQSSEPSVRGPVTKAEDNVVNAEKQKLIDCYWQLLRTHQLIQVLRWMEEAGEDWPGYTQGDLASSASPHYLLVCTEEDVQSAFLDAFRQTDEELLQQGIVQSGATACVALLRPLVDFQRLLAMRPEELTDEDWQLFNGNSFSFPESGADWRENEFGDHAERKCRATFCFSEATAASAEGTAGPRPETSPEIFFSTANQTHGLSQGDASPASKQQGDIGCARLSSSFSEAGCPPAGVSCSGPGERAESTKSRGKSSLLSIKLSVAHLGDSRALLVAMDGSCERLTAASDHKASSSQEVQRVEEAGGWVFGERVNGMLAIGRAFGDWCLKLNGDDLKVFSASTLTGINAEGIADRDDRMNSREETAEPNRAAECPDFVADNSVFQMLRDDIGGYISRRLEAATSTRSHSSEGTGKAGEPAQASQLTLSAGLQCANVATSKKVGLPAGKRHDSSRHHALVVSNAPDIRTTDITAAQGPDMSSSSAGLAPETREAGLNGETSEPARSDSHALPEGFSVSSLSCCGLTSPPVLLLLGCDGLFDVCSDNAVTAVALEFLRALQEAHPDMTPSNAAEAVARALIEEAITFRGSTDNVSVTVALLLPLDFAGKQDGVER